MSSAEKYTKEQREAIEARGQIIVSASAGSGKTHTMIERCLDLLKKGESIRSMLAVTFTNKAAAEMRERIRGKLIECLEEEGSPALHAHLTAQLRALPLADFCTIHAFCGRLVRTYFYLLEIDPRFRIVGEDDAEGQSLSARALNTAFEEAYEEGGEQFDALLAVYFRKKKDARLRGIVTAVYAKLREEADWRKRAERLYEEGVEGAFSTAECQLAEDIAFRVEKVCERAETVREGVMQYAKGAADTLEAAIDAAKRLAGCKTVFAMQTLPPPEIPRRPNVNKNDPNNIYYSERVSEIASEAKALYKLPLAYGSREEELERCRRVDVLAKAVLKLVLRYDEVYADVKREAGVLDYSDLEHFALRILDDEGALKAVRSQYRHVFVDEYQDVNPLQETLIRLVGGEGTSDDVFLVGDPKQAIYAFRGSRSEIFKRRFSALKEGGAGNHAITLSQNFRSTEEVLAAVNAVFKSALKGYDEMKGTLGSDRGGGVYVYEAPEESKPETPPRAVYSVMAGTAASPSEDFTALCALDIVRREHGKTYYNIKEKEAVPVKYRDIAVLVRKRTGSAGKIVRLLSENGIPVSSTAPVNICDYFEVRLLIDWLSFLDNPEQDIPLATAMLSAIGGFTNGELATIRLKVEKTLRVFPMSFRATVKAYQSGYAEGGDALAQKLARFFERAAHLSDLARVKSAAEMLDLLLAEGLEAQIAAKGRLSGERGTADERLARVHRLISESEKCGSVHEFLRRLDDADMRIDFTEIGGEDAVHVMTMHAAKGLEYPIVLVADLDTNFHPQDRSDVMVSGDLGLLPRCFDTQEKTYSETLLRDAAALRERRETREGELNLLYVAMTRAQSRLHLIFGKEQNGPKAGEEGSESIRKTEEAFRYRPEEAGKMSDYIPRNALPKGEALRHADGASEEREERAESDAAIVAAILAAGAPYPYAESGNIPVKDSATGLLERRGGLPHVYFDDDISDMGGGFDTETGTAYHAFLQFYSFGKDAKEELARMQRENLLTREQVQRIDVEHLLSITQIPALRRLEGKELLREQRFLVTLSADCFSDVYAVAGGRAAGEDVIFQGAIDLLLCEDGKYTVYDYKYSSRRDRDLTAHYEIQMRLYRKAVAKIKGVKEEDVGVYLVNIARGSVLPM